MLLLCPSTLATRLFPLLAWANMRFKTILINFRVIAQSMLYCVLTIIVLVGGWLSGEYGNSDQWSVR